MVSVVKVDEPIIARAFSFGWHERIFVGDRYFKLSTNLQRATLAHECGHIALRHSEQRMLKLIFMPWDFKGMCKRQEFAADRWAAERGFGKDLILLLASDYDGGELQPSHEDRRFHLEQYEQTRSAPVKSHLRIVGVTDQGVEK